jgi:hypothetical protein
VAHITDVGLRAVAESRVARSSSRLDREWEGQQTSGEQDEFSAEVAALTDAVGIGGAALAAEVALTELRPAEGGLEDMFLELTADTQRDNHPERTAA